MHNTAATQCKKLALHTLSPTAAVDATPCQSAAGTPLHQQTRHLRWLMTALSSPAASRLWPSSAMGAGGKPVKSW